MKATVAVVAAFIAFWCFVLWVADAFAPWELAAILSVVVVASFFGWVLCRAAGLADEREEEMRPVDWEWPDLDDDTRRFLGRLDDHQRRVAAMFEAEGVNYWGDDEDWSSVRHGGLGR